jgi:sporulation protein YlmC with PRC-barrel domain
MSLVPSVHNRHLHKHGTLCPALAPTTAGATEIFLRQPAGTTVTNFYKQNVYDPSDNKIGGVDDILIDKEGRVTAVIIGVGGFLGMGQREEQQMVIGSQHEQGGFEDCSRVHL